MKKIVALIVFAAIMSNELFAQNSKLNWIGINASVSTAGPIRFGGYAGGLGYESKTGFLLGIGYLRVINDKFDFESGIDYSKHSFTSYYDDSGQTVDIEDPDHVYLLTVPVNFRVKFRKRFFVTGGIMYDQEFNGNDSPRIDDQTGIGINFKFGKDFRLSDKMIIYVAPELIVHALVPFNPEKSQQRLIELGLRISYKFGL